MSRNNDGNGRLVFICDDEPAISRRIAAFVASHGCGALELSTGTDLMAALLHQKPTAIVLDLFMPEMNGWEALARVKSDPETRDIPIIIVSALSPEETGTSMQGLAAWIQKPFVDADLAAALGTLLHRKD